jgi:ATP-dependent Lhr-like helicase
VTPFDRLHPAIQHHIVNSLGWRSLRPLQNAAIAPILAGTNALLLAPTAGGKTEAAVLPLFSRLLSDSWKAVSVLYVCPIKALLNNLELRLRQYGGLLGRRVAVWHGDVEAGDRGRILKDPPDLLLTTPESLEVMLVSGRTDHGNLFASVRAMVVDEIHAFAGDDRGWHLLAVLDRISYLSEHTIQRVGLSATAGNPGELLGSLEGSGESPGVVVASPSDDAAGPLVEVDYVGGLNNAAIVISRLHRGHKRLVFCDSRSQAESLAGQLRQLEVQTFVSHSSLSAEERRRTEAAFAEASNCVIVATSTLELGIDVGDLDRVIQIDAPHTVSSFLQRLGRSGRREGTRRNCLFVATSEEFFLRTLGLLRLWSEGYVEPVMPPPQPYHVVAQQLMALALQDSGVGPTTWPGWLEGFLRSARFSRDDCERLVAHMLDHRYLFQDQGILHIGAAAEEKFGRRHFLELFSVFDAPPLFAVYYGRAELGTVHPLTFQVQRAGPVSLSLGGRYWLVKHVDWKRRRAYVEPSVKQGKSRWFGAGQPLHYEFCQAVLEVLAGTEPAVALSRRAQSALAHLRSEYEWADPRETTLVNDEKHVAWWTFGGAVLNGALAHRLAGRIGRVTYDDSALHAKSGQADAEIASDVGKMLEDEDHISPAVRDDVQEDLKFGACVPQELLGEMIGERFSCSEDWQRLKGKRLRVVQVD